MTIAIFALLAYLLGSVSFAVVSSWIFKLPDPRTYGSMNPGATNVLRSGKKAAAVMTLLGDAGKGWLAVILAQYYAPFWGLGNGAMIAFAGAMRLQATPDKTWQPADGFTVHARWNLEMLETPGN